MTTLWPNQFYNDRLFSPNFNTVAAPADAAGLCPLVQQHPFAWNAWILVSSRTKESLHLTNSVRHTVDNPKQFFA